MTQSLRGGAGRAPRATGNQARPIYRERATSATRSHSRRPTTPEEREQREQERQARLEALHAKLAGEVEALVNGDEWQAMLAQPRSSTALDSASHHPTVMEVLAAFIRGHSQERWPVPAPSDARHRAEASAQAAAIGRASLGSSSYDGPS